MFDHYLLDKAYLCHSRSETIQSWQDMVVDPMRYCPSTTLLQRLRQWNDSTTLLGCCLFHILLLRGFPQVLDGASVYLSNCCQKPSSSTICSLFVSHKQVWGARKLH